MTMTTDPTPTLTLSDALSIVESLMSEQRALYTIDAVCDHPGLEGTVTRRTRKRIEALTLVLQALRSRRSLKSIVRECENVPQAMDLLLFADRIIKIAEEGLALFPDDKCHRCSDCEGQEHHWQDGITTADHQSYLCKHCGATAPACEECGGIVLPQCIDLDCAAEQQERESTEPHLEAT